MGYQCNLQYRKRRKLTQRKFIEILISQVRRGVLSWCIILQFMFMLDLCNRNAINT